MSKKQVNNIDFDQVVELIIEGMTYRDMANVFKVKLSTLSDFIARPEHSARAREALNASADIFADKSEQVLHDAEWDPQKFDYDLKKARELSQHYRWKAAKRNPSKYSEKQQLDVKIKKIGLDLAEETYE